MIRNILVPLDGSSFGEQAMPWALTIARRSKAQVHLLHVHRSLEATYAELQVFDTTLDQQLRAREQAYLDNAVRTAAAASGLSVVAANRDGEISTIICDHAAAAAADLIVMTAHARGPLGRFWLGSVADELLRAAPAPLLLVHPEERAAEWKEDRPLRSILVPLDGSPLAEQILPTASNLARIMGASLTLLRVIRPVAPMKLPVGPHSLGDVAHHMTERIDQLHQQLQKEAHEYLDAVRNRLLADGLSVVTQIAVEEQPGVAILHRAQEPIDMIALETHGRRGLARLLLGSVADKVIRGAHVPVLVQRPAPGLVPNETPALATS